MDMLDYSKAKEQRLIKTKLDRVKDIARLRRLIEQGKELENKGYPTSGLNKESEKLLNNLIAMEGEGE